MFGPFWYKMQGWLKSTSYWHLNTGSFPRNHIWVWGVLKKSIFAYLKFHICIPLPKFQRPRISESKVFPCLQCVSSDRKNQNIRHSWKRLWILTRALGHTNTGVNIRILPKIFVWLFPVATHVKNPNHCSIQNDQKSLIWIPALMESHKCIPGAQIFHI